MNTSSTRIVPPDLKSIMGVSRHENLIEALRTIMGVILMAAIFLAAVYVTR